MGSAAGESAVLGGSQANCSRRRRWFLRVRSLAVEARERVALLLKKDRAVVVYHFPKEERSFQSHKNEVQLTARVRRCRQPPAVCDADDYRLAATSSGFIFDVTTALKGRANRQLRAHRPPERIQRSHTRASRGGCSPAPRASAGNSRSHAHAARSH